MKPLARALPALAALLLASLPAAAQTAPPDGRKVLDHEAYALWNRIDAESLSPDGGWLAWQLVPGDGDGAVVVRRTSGSPDLRVERGAAPVFTDDSRFLVMTVKPSEAAVEEAEKLKKKEPKTELPKDSLAIVDLRALAAGDAAGAVRRVADVASFRVSEEGAARVAWLHAKEKADEEADSTGTGEAGGAAGEPVAPGAPAPAEPAVEPEPPAQPGAEPGAEPAAEEQEPSPREKRRKDKDDGAVLVLLDPATGAEARFEHAVDYRFTEDGSRLYYTASSKDGTADGVYRVRSADGTASPMVTGEGRYLRLAVSEATGQVAFLTDRDDQDAEKPALALWSADASDAAAEPLVAADAPGLPAGWWISGDGEVRFSERGTRVFFGTAERPEPEGDDDEDVPDDEKVVVDVWNWQDDYLQPMQLVQAERNGDRAFLATVPAGGGAVVQLATKDLPDVTVADDGDGDVAIAETDRPYRQLLSWDGRYNDIWVVDVDTGERRLVAERVRGFGGGSMSPGGRWIQWWDGEAREWAVLDVSDGSAWRATSRIPTELHDELDDHPQDPPPYGTAGWTEDGRLLVYDAYDVWLVDPRQGGDEPRNLTEGLGRREGLRLRYVRTDPEADFVPMDEPVLLSAFSPETKQDGLYRDRFDGTAEPRRLLMGDFALGTPRRAEDAEDVWMLTRQTFVDFPDLHVSGPGFADMRKLSDANPQQADYRWGSVELVEWTSTDGEELQGLLYKPDGFDPSREYPMMVYFYERYSDGLHRHHVPAPGSSSINFSFYVSRGYLLFVPDIPYEIGFPGESALDAVVPGVLNLVAQGFVDRDRIGVQGHSWGGYQIAHMITRTNLFAAAEAGAPVANMTSAYGGIRWGTGMSRMFQYERTQSRIGGTLWDAQHRYIENSPLFFADKIETPLLMMHNDEDGAVPWYQGIEMFVALRRLGKPVFMLNYNGEDHGLRQEHNRKDWAVRMQQFFDHYLMDAPPPVWMAEGVPAELKGETLGLELVTEKAAKPVTEQGGNGGNR